jgi:hypothetical protein
MKKTMIITAFLLATGLTAVWANGDNGLSQEISNSFSKEFGTATHVNWQKKDSYTIASFTLNDQVLYAYYSQNGQLNSVVHNILSDHLPVLLLAQLKNYKGYWISDLYEGVINGHSSYYATLENGDRKMILKSNYSTHWDIIKSVNKNILHV